MEPDEGFTVTLSGPAGGTLGTATALGTIQNDDATLSIAATSAVKAEGNAGSTAFTFTVTRSGDTSGVSSVNYAVTGSGANPANAADFAGSVLPSGTVNFAATQTSQVVTINVNGDTALEPDEGFTVTLSAQPARRSARPRPWARSRTTTLPHCRSPPRMPSSRKEMRGARPSPSLLPATATPAATAA